MSGASLPSGPSPTPSYETGKIPTRRETPDTIPPAVQERILTSKDPGVNLKSKSWSQAKAKEAITQFFSTKSPVVLTKNDKLKLVHYFATKLKYSKAFERMSISGKQEHKALFEEASRAKTDFDAARNTLVKSSKGLIGLAAVLEQDLPIFKNTEKLISPEGDERSELRGQYDRYRKLLNEVQEGLEDGESEPVQADPFLNELQERIGASPANDVMGEDIQIPETKLTAALLFARLKAKYLSQAGMKIQKLLESLKARISKEKMPPLEGKTLKLMQDYLSAWQTASTTKNALASYVSEKPHLVKDLIEQTSQDPKLSSLLKEMKLAQETLEETKNGLNKNPVASLYFQNILGKMKDYVDANSLYALRYQELAINKDVRANRIRSLFLKANQAKEKADRATAALMENPQYRPILENTALLVPLLQIVKEQLNEIVAQRVEQAQEPVRKEEAKRMAAQKLLKDRKMGRVPVGLPESELKRVPPKAFIPQLQELARQAGPEDPHKRLLAIAKLELAGLKKNKREGNKLDEANIQEKQAELARLQGIKQEDAPPPAAPSPDASQEEILKMIEESDKRSALQQLKSDLAVLDVFRPDESVPAFFERVAKVQALKKKIHELDPSFSLAPVDQAEAQPQNMELDDEEIEMLQALKEVKEEFAPSAPPPVSREPLAASTLIEPDDVFALLGVEEVKEELQQGENRERLATPGSASPLIDPDDVFAFLGVEEVKEEPSIVQLGEHREGLAAPGSSEPQAASTLLEPEDVFAFLGVEEEKPATLQLPSPLTEEAIATALQGINAIEDEEEQNRQIDALDALMEQRPKSDQELFRAVFFKLMEEERAKQ